MKRSSASNKKTAQPPPTSPESDVADQHNSTPMTLRVKVKPNAKTQSIQVQEDGSWLVHLKSPPVDGKANAELMQLLAKQFHLPKSAIKIKSGSSSKYKLIEIDSD